MQVAPRKQSGSVLFAIIAWLFFLYLFIQILSFFQGVITNPIVGGLYFILFGIHEAAHFVFAFAPPVVTAAAGSLSEIVFTLLLVAAAVKARSYVAASFSLIWMMLAMSSAGRYMADAVPQLLPLVGPGDSPRHDWHFVFSQTGLLEQSMAIGDTVRFVGYGVGVVGLMVGIIYIMKLLVRSA